MTKDYAALTTKEAKYDAVAKTKGVEELDAMWAAWEKQGYSREGLLYAAVLRRKQELGAVLESDQEAAIELAEKRRKEGAKLPPITGEVKG